MFGISMWELMLIMVVALIALGPRQLTETARAAGKFYRDLQKMLHEVRSSIDFDALTADPEPPKPKPAPPPEPVDPPKDSPALGEKTGPDFYADLLEKSSEDKEKLVETTEPVTPEDEKKIDPDKKTGPDFYADLVEKSSGDNGKLAEITEPGTPKHETQTDTGKKNEK